MHVFAPELEAALRPSLRERSRYLPKQWAHGPDWVEHRVEGEQWLGFESVRPLPGIETELALVPLVGHTAGHCGVAVSTGGGWLLHCGDAFFHRGQVATPPSCPPGMRLFQALTARDRAAREANAERLRALAAEQGERVRLICSHDPAMMETAVTAA